MNEVNTALFPVLTVIVLGQCPRTQFSTVFFFFAGVDPGAGGGTPPGGSGGRRGGCSEVDIGGQRDELVEVLIDPTIFETYQITFEELISQIERNNRLIAAGTIETQAGGAWCLKVPGLIENEADVR